MSTKQKARPRPLSPHLSIYKPIPTMMMSIVHRITGIGLYFGMALIAWWLLAVASGPAAFGTASAIFGSVFGLIVFFLITWALMHHIVGGLRHLVWDTGKLMAREQSREIAIATPFVSGGLTVIVWFIAFVVV